MEASGNLEDSYTKVPNLNATLNWEIDATIKYALLNPKESYRRLSYLMIDEDIVYLTPSTVYRILSERDLLCRYKRSDRSPGRYDFNPISRISNGTLTSCTYGLITAGTFLSAFWMPTAAISCIGICLRQHRLLISVLL